VTCCDRQGSSRPFKLRIGQNLLSRRPDELQIQRVASPRNQLNRKAASVFAALLRTAYL
jgi:hypothetical protein